MNKVSLRLPLLGSCFFFAASTASAQAPLPWAQACRTDGLSQPRDTLASASVGSLAIFAGGAASAAGFVSGVVDIYDADSDSWSTAALSVPRAAVAGTSAGPLALFAGGDDGGFSDVVDIYDSASGMWSVDKLSAPRILPAGTSHGSLAFFAGGVAPGGTGSNVVDIYDAVTGLWKPTSTLSVGRVLMGAASAGQKVLFAGGFDFNSGAVFGNVDIYDVSSGTWSAAPLSVPRFALSATAVGSKILFAGGFDATFAASDVVDIYDTATNIWSIATPLSLARGWLAATTVGDNALFAGGTDDFSAGPTGLYFDTVDIYDGSQGTWSQDSLSEARAYLSAETVRGRAMVAGGWTTPNDSFCVVDVFDFDVGTSYCTGVPNSTGSVGRVCAIGSPIAAANDLVLTATELPPNQFGYFLTSETQGFLANPGGSQGNLCLGGSIGRYNRSGEILSSKDGGTFSLTLDLNDTPQPLGPVSILAGDTWNFTAWFRDVNPTSTSNFTEAVSVSFQ